MRIGGAFADGQGVGGFARGPGRALVPVDIRPPVATGRVGATDREDESGRIEAIRPEGQTGLDVRRMSPRQMAHLSLDLYVSGILDWEEYSMLAFQPELHPDYNRTVGALTGEMAKPDLPRDQVAAWEEQLRFEQAHNRPQAERVGRTRRIVQVLRQLAMPIDVVV